MLRLSHIAATGLLLLGLSANLSAEAVNLPTLETEVTESAIPNETPTQASEYSIQLPGRGMSMEMVQNRFGEPLEKEPAVGEPPISKWTFNNFTVYFESEFVIHAVVNN